MSRHGSKLRKAKRTTGLEDPFDFLAKSMTIDSDQDWEEEPVPIQQFIEDKEFLNLKWNGKRGCRPKIMEIAKELAKPEIREAMLLLGKGSGKDFISSIFHLYGIYRCLCMTSPQKYHGLSPGSAIYFVNTARNDTQARNVFFAEFKGMLESCPWFENKFDEPGATSIKFNKNITAMSANSQAFGWLGYNTLQWVGDELAFFLEKDADEESDSRAEECWIAAEGSAMTRFRHHYKLIGITTPRFDDDFVMRKFHELRDNPDGSAFTAQAATWDMNPLLTIEDWKHKLEKNYRRTMRDYGAVPMGVIESFWADPDFIENNVCEICKGCPVYANRETSGDLYACYDYSDCKANAYIGNGKWHDWLHADPNAEYYLHFDLSKNKDRVGFSIGHVIDYIEVELDTFEIMDGLKKGSKKYEDVDPEDKFAQRPITKIDALGFIDPSSKRDPQMIKNGEIYYDAILKYIVRHLMDRGFNIGKITMDQFQSHHFKQTIEDYGITAELLSLDRNDEVPSQAKDTLTENRVIYPYSLLLCREAKHLKYINGRKIDHAKGESKDIWDGFAGAIYGCELNDSGQGSFEIIDY